MHMQDERQDIICEADCLRAAHLCTDIRAGGAGVHKACCLGFELF